MFFKRREAPQRRRGAAAEATPTALSPRFARLVRESWWLLVVAVFVWLALVLATYSKADPSFSLSTSATSIANVGGVMGAWTADLLLKLLGWSAWWCVVAGIALVVAGYRRIQHPDLESEHPLRLGVLGFVLVLLTSAAMEALRHGRHRTDALPDVPGGIFGDVIGGALGHFLGFNGAML